MNTSTYSRGPVPPEFQGEYLLAARFYAETTRLPFCMGSPGAVDWIYDNPDAFLAKVAECKKELQLSRQ